MRGVKDPNEGFKYITVPDPYFIYRRALSIAQKRIQLLEAEIISLRQIIDKLEVHW